MKWVLRPPQEIRTHDKFHVTFFLGVKPNFYKWAVENGRFENVGPGNLK